MFLGNANGEERHHIKQEQPSAYLQRSSYGDSLYGSGGGHPALGRTPGTEIRQYWYYRDSHKYNKTHSTF